MNTGNFANIVNCTNHPLRFFYKSDVIKSRYTEKYNLKYQKVRRKNGEMSFIYATPYLEIPKSFAKSVNSAQKMNFHCYQGGIPLGIGKSYHYMLDDVALETPIIRPDTIFVVSRIYAADALFKANFGENIPYLQRMYVPADTVTRKVEGRTKENDVRLETKDYGCTGLDKAAPLLYPSTYLLGHYNSSVYSMYNADIFTLHNAINYWSSPLGVDTLCRRGLNQELNALTELKGILYNLQLQLVQ